MKIALIGYGKMGKEIEKIALERNHQIELIIDKDKQLDLTREKLKNIDVAIEFSKPDAAVANYIKCFKSGVPVVSGTTGWFENTDTFSEIKTRCLQEKQTFFYASNFSLGVNIFFKLNSHLAKIMNQFPAYEIAIEEQHHIHKLDAPSGTAISLANEIARQIERKTTWQNRPQAGNSSVKINSVRDGEIPGTHIVSYDSEIDKIEIKHQAKNRKGFALGAVLAAEFCLGKTGVFGMDDLLNVI